ncbi:hypothetical protein [uncultured Robinsoniella sp.]|uniref:hypothetical protein n=1 Tax=uncultured Robinsoniella sp. TaxID=904190 RepID=UPI00374E6EBD
MVKYDWKDYEITIGPPETPEDEKITMHIHGEKSEDTQQIMKSAFYNAKKYYEDAKKVDDDSQLVLCALSCELLIKAIIIKTQNKIIRGHDLYALYNELNQEEQDYILKCYIGDCSDQELDDLIDDFFNSLQLDARIFETIRYKHEFSTIIYFDYFLFVFAQLLIKLGDEIKILE